MKKPEILQELPKCDPEMPSEQMLLERWRQSRLAPRGVAANLQLVEEQYPPGAVRRGMPVPRCACLPVALAAFLGKAALSVLCARPWWAHALASLGPVAGSGRVEHFWALDSVLLAVMYASATLF